MIRLLAYHGPLVDGLWRQMTPNLPSLSCVRCEWCGCSVPMDHRPNGDDCRMLQEERRHKYAT